MTVTLAPHVPRSRRQRVTGPLLLAGGVLGASVLLHLRDPHQSGAWGYCPWLLLTGTYCPGCGGLRAVNDLTHGHLAAAASSNLLLVGLIPLLGLLYARWTLATWRGTDIALLPRVPRAAAIGLVVLVVTFVVARNVPGSWLAP